MRRPATLFAWFVVVSLLTRWLSLVVGVLDTDEAAHAVGSWVLLDGGRLYTDFVDNKPPLLYAYYALAQLLLGRGLFAVHAFTATLSVPLTALAASAAFRHDRRGVAAGLIWLVYGASFLAHDMLAANAELILLLPASWAIALTAFAPRVTRATPLFFAGLLLGIATLVKHQAVFWLPAVAWAALPSLPRPEARSRGLALAAGFSLPLAATWAAFALSGGADDILYWLVWRNVLYAVNPITAEGALQQATRYLLPWLLATAPLWWAWRSSRPGLEPHHRRLIDGLVGLGLLGALPGFRFFPHYFVPAVFALALGAAPAVARWCARPLARTGRVFLATTLVLASGFALANAWLYLGGGNVYRETDPVYRVVAEQLQADECFPGSRSLRMGLGAGVLLRGRFARRATGLPLRRARPGGPHELRARQPRRGTAPRAGRARCGACPLGLADGRSRAHSRHLRPRHGPLRPLPLGPLSPARLSPARALPRLELRAARRGLECRDVQAARLRERATGRRPRSVTVGRTTTSADVYWPPTCSRTRRASSFALGVSSASSAVMRPKRSRRPAMRPVQPVWWLAPRPAPMSPWKYS